MTLAKVIRKGKQPGYVRAALHCTLFIIHCTLNPILAQPASVISGTWIGVHAEWENTFFCPLPTYLDLRADSTMHLGMTDNTAPAKTARWSLRGDTLRLDSLVYPPKLWRIEGELLRLGLLYPMVFRRLTDVPLNAQISQNQLVGRVWQTDSLAYQFYKSGKVCIENLRTNERTVHCWQTVQRGPSVFLTMRGNQHTCDGNYKPLWQLTHIQENNFSAIGWQGKGVAEIPFRFMRALAAEDSCRSTGFQPCSNCLFMMYAVSGHVLKTEERAYQVKKIVREQFRAVTLPGQSGLIRVQFAVNCWGETGKFDLVGFSETYAPMTFDPRLTDQLTALCKTQLILLWQTPDVKDHDYDETVRFSVRLKDGAILDVFF
jgi:hypothetical protein